MISLNYYIGVKCCNKHSRELNSENTEQNIHLIMVVMFKVLHTKIMHFINKCLDFFKYGQLKGNFNRYDLLLC